MTQAVTVRRDGDAFQARCFWLKAARLLDPQSPIARVGFEIGPKAFDDIWVDYDPARAPIDHEGRPLRREHVQCKWHVTPNVFGYGQLVEPDFINANARSLLERARTAQLAHAPAGEDRSLVRYRYQAFRSFLNPARGRTLQSSRWRKPDSTATPEPGWTSTMSVEPRCPVWSVRTSRSDSGPGPG